MAVNGAFALDCPSLHAKIRGAVDTETGIVSFRGLPYADLKQRWTYSSVKDSLHVSDSAAFDATCYGPRCPQAEGLVLVSGGLNDPTPGDDEFACLNLNVAVKISHLAATTKLPVMVWIHGGAFLYGANSVARYRPERFLDEAEFMGKPVILVQINYRLGVFGFAASNDLNSVTGEPGGQYGLHDQRNALMWVQRHIADFNGDPDNVTVFGVSAGSASVHAHVVAGNALFDRGIMMSGSLGTLIPSPPSLYQKAWDDVVSAANLGGLASLERIAKMREMNASELAKIYSKAALGPHGGKGLHVSLPTTWSHSPDTTISRCKSLIIGDTRVEAVILAGLVKSIPFARFRAWAHEHFKGECPAFLDTFGFSERLSSEAYQDAMYSLLSVVMFQYPGVIAAKSFAKAGNAYYYHFEEDSPFEGPTFGMSYHGQCALYLHLNESDALPKHGIQTSKYMIEQWVNFAHGKEDLWQKVSSSDVHPSFMRFGPNGVSSPHSVESDTLRSYNYLSWLSLHWDATKFFIQKILHGAWSSEE